MVLVYWKKSTYIRLSACTPHSMSSSADLVYDKFLNCSLTVSSPRTFSVCSIYIYMYQVERICFWSCNLHILNSTQTYTCMYTHTDSNRSTASSCAGHALHKHTVPIHSVSLIDLYIYCGSFSADDSKCLQEGALFLMYTKVPYGLAMTLDSYLPCAASWCDSPEFCFGSH